MIVNDLEALQVFRCAAELGWEGNTAIEVTVDRKRKCIVVKKARTQPSPITQPTLRLVRNAENAE